MRHVEGNNYHIYNRGNNKELIFIEEDIYIYFLEQFKKYVLPSITVYAYCLMPNHFHLFIIINNLNNFESGIKNFLILYSKSINKKYNRVGSLFQGRFKSSEIKTYDYYTKIITYIHQNPLRAKLVNSLKDYRFPSYYSYFSEKASLLNRTEVLKWFGGVKQFQNCDEISLEKT